MNPQTSTPMSDFPQEMSGQCRVIFENPTSEHLGNSMGFRLNVGFVGFLNSEEIRVVSSKRACLSENPDVGFVRATRHLDQKNPTLTDINPDLRSLPEHKDKEFSNDSADSLDARTHNEYISSASCEIKSDISDNSNDSAGFSPSDDTAPNANIETPEEKAESDRLTATDACGDEPPPPDDEPPPPDGEDPSPEEEQEERRRCRMNDDDCDEGERF